MYVSVKPIKWLKGVKCFRVVKTDIPHMKGRKYTINDLRVARSLNNMSIKRLR